MTKDSVRGFIVASILAVATPSSSGAQVGPLPTSPQGIPIVAVTGHGEAHIPPDRATVVLSVETTGLAAAEVGATNAHIQRRILDTLRALGYTGSEVSTTSYNLTPNFEPAPNTSERTQRGYIAKNAVRVKLTQLDRIGIVIDAALARGANGVDGLSFEASNTDAARQTALTDATTQARLNATTLAKALGGTLGKLIDLTMQDAQSYVMSKMRFEQTSITPTDLTIESNVVARWQFVPGR